MCNERAQCLHLIECSTRHLSDQIPDGTRQTAPDQAEPNQSQRFARSMTGYAQQADKPVNLARPASSKTVRPKPRAADLAVSDLRTRRRHHAISAEGSTPPEGDTL